MNTIIKFLFYSIRMGVPLLFGTTGEIVSEKSGSLNLGVEGLMAMGAIGGYYFGCKTNSMIVALLAAFLCAALGGLVYSFLTITFQANQNVTGLTLTIFGVGVYEFIGRSLTSGGKYPVMDEASQMVFMKSDIGIPVLRDIPYIGTLLFSYNIMVYISVLVAVVLWIYITKTKTGLKLRATGENYGAADACGVNVSFYRYMHTVCGAGITGLGGLYLGVVINGGAWNESWINGMGWISVALVIFAKWNPAKAIFGSFLFGALTVLQSWKGNLKEAFPDVLGWVDVIPNEFYQMLPFVITFIVLVVSSIRDKGRGEQPTCCGINYYREER
ncbi:MAG: ABC transporter permease [Clostridia bacterium]|nr:ABC transporter permease [Clostridia bacterium]